MMTLRSLLFVIYMYGLMAIMGLACLPLLLFPGRVLMGVIRLYIKCVRLGLRLICGIKTEIRGLEHIPSGAYILAAKHQCMWDVFIPFLVCDAPTIIMKKELLWYPVLGWYALRSGMIPIDRAGTTKTLREMTKIAKDRADDGRQVVIFPEGTRIAPGAPTKYHSAGLASLYKALDVPVLPVATNAGLFWPAKGLRRNKGTIVYEFLPVIPAGTPRKDMMQKVETEIESHSRALLPVGFLQDELQTQ